MKASVSMAFPLLVFYLCFVLTITLIERVPGEAPHYELELFWSYKEVWNGRTGLFPELFWNVVLFVPAGWFLSVCLPKKRKWLSLLIGMMFSACIELTQLFTCRGWFEFDDIFNNSLGTLIGLLLYLPWCLETEASDSREM